MNGGKRRQRSCAGRKEWREGRKERVTGMSKVVTVKVEIRQQGKEGRR